MANTGPYTEGPFVNWTEVSFPRGDLGVTLLTPFFGNPGTVDGTCVIGGLEDFEPTPDDMFGFLVGQSSGAVLDTRFLPLTAFWSTTLPVTPACLPTLSNLYTITGSPVTAVPGVGYNRAVALPGVGARVSIVSRQSYTFNPGDPGPPVIPPSCDADGNAPVWPISPMFSFGEVVKKFDVWPPP